MAGGRAPCPVSGAGGRKRALLELDFWQSSLNTLSEFSQPCWVWPFSPRRKLRPQVTRLGPPNRKALKCRCGRVVVPALSLGGAGRFGDSATGIGRRPCCDGPLVPVAAADYVSDGMCFTGFPFLTAQSRPRILVKK